MNRLGSIKIMSLLTILIFCLFAYALTRYCSPFRECEITLCQEQWLLVVCLMAWCSCFFVMTFVRHDWLLISLIVIVVAVYFTGYPDYQAMDVLAVLFGAILGKGVKFMLQNEKGKAESGNLLEVWKSEAGSQNFLLGLVLLLAFASSWHLDMSDNYYHGPRWMGLWNNPNSYGMLMGGGLVLAIGLLAESRKSKVERLKTGGDQKSEVRSQNQARRGWNLLRSLRSFAAIKSAILLIAAFMMGVGLLFSYSRGAWVGTAIGVLYLAKAYGKFKWRWALPPVLLITALVCFFWHNTPDSASWVVKRLDLSRPSAQHRVAAWHGAVQMMWDHPFGLGWSKAVEVYQNNYSSPEVGAAAITTNDYLMLGTQIGIPALLCFIVYVALRLGVDERFWKKAESAGGKNGNRKTKIGNEAMSPVTCHPSTEASLRVACRAGALVLAVAFWFNGGLFILATASVFWILLELGAETQKRNAASGRAETETSLVASIVGK